jgi:hypothetical protein
VDKRVRVGREQCVVRRFEGWKVQGLVGGRMRCELGLRFLFGREWGHGTVPDVENVHSVFAFV